MIFRQITHDDLGCASYLIGDEQAGVAAVVDPQLAIGEYLRLARYLGVHVDHVLETHTHADHVSGHGRLAAATGARVHVHRDAGAAYEHEPFEDGWELELGALRVRALHTPGHRPEHTAFVLTDGGRGPEPWAVLTGDSLFVGDLARPDLAVEPHAGARELFHSLHERLLTLPDTCEVWPGHLGGSLCGGADMDLKTSSTIGFERAHQRLLGIGDADAFVEAATTALRPQPPNFRNIVELNRGPFVLDGDNAHPLTSRQLHDAQSRGALAIDVRTELQFDEAHVPGALCLTTRRAGFGSKLAWVATPDRPLLIVGRDDEDAHEAIALAAAVGLTNVHGWLAGGMTSWREDALPVEHVERMTVPELHARWAAESAGAAAAGAPSGAPGLQLLDVRERDEWSAAHIPGAAFTPYHDIDRVPDGLDPARPIATICASGQRAAVAASLLQHHGARHVIHVVEGGVPRWQREGFPVESPGAGAQPPASTTS